MISSSNGFNLLLYLSVYQNVNVNSTNGSVNSKDWQELRLGLSMHRQSKSSDTNSMVVSVFNHGCITSTCLVSFYNIIVQASELAKNEVGKILPTWQQVSKLKFSIKYAGRKISIVTFTKM